MYLLIFWGAFQYNETKTKKEKQNSKLLVHLIQKQ